MALGASGISHGRAYPSSPSSSALSLSFSRLTTHPMTASTMHCATSPAASLPQSWVNQPSLSRLLKLSGHKPYSPHISSPYSILTLSTPSLLSSIQIESHRRCPLPCPVPDHTPSIEWTGNLCTFTATTPSRHIVAYFTFPLHINDTLYSVPLTFSSSLRHCSWPSDTTMCPGLSCSHSPARSGTHLNSSARTCNWPRPSTSQQPNIFSTFVPSSLTSLRFCESLFAEPRHSDVATTLPAPNVNVCNRQPTTSPPTVPLLPAAVFPT